MCHDGNSAGLSTRYLNSQLTTLWQNAVQCTEETKNNALDVVSPHFQKSKHVRALSQFHYFGPKAPKNPISTADFFFYARFGQPDLKFTCNHEAILSLTVERANLNLDFGKSSITGACVDHQMNRDIRNVQVTYRLPFHRYNVKTSDAVLDIRPFNNIVRLVVLVLCSAKLANLKSDVSLSADTENALKFYLVKYLNFLHESGCDFLYDVPHTDDMHIDYSLQKELFGKTEFTGSHVRSVDVRSINEYLYWQWQNAVRLGRPADHLSTCLAEISSAWVPNFVVANHFFIRFRAPEIKALCPHEAVLLLQIEDIAWFDNSNFAIAKTEVYHNWTVAFIIDTVEEKEGSITRIRLRLDTARYSVQHSRRLETSDALKYYSLLVTFLKGNYLEILKRYSYDVVYESESIQEEFVPTIELTYKPGVPPTDDVIVAWTRQIQELRFYGYDQITALSEESINLMYSSLWEEANRRSTDNLLAKLTLDRFKASFSAPTVRLLSNGKAIIWITLKRGEMIVQKEDQRKDFWTWPMSPSPQSGEGTERFSFADASALAFQVDLDFLDDGKLSVNERWHNKESWVRLDEKRNWNVFRHLVLNFGNATYIPQLSTITGLGNGRESLSRLGAMVQFVKDYLVKLSDDGYNIIYSVPLWTQRKVKVNYALTDAKHLIVTKNWISTQNCGVSRTVYESPVILILGMTNYSQMPTTTVPWHDTWVMHSRTRKTLGTVYLSNDSFLGAHLLPLLERVNRKTTLIPKFAGAVNGEWLFDVSTWEQDPYRSKQLCNWERGTGTSGNYLEYVWDYYDEWAHRHKATVGDEKNAESALACSTTNKVVVPTTYRSDGLDIELKGESRMKVSGKGAVQDWSKESTATWSSTIHVSSGSKGIDVSLSNNIKPVFSAVVSEGQCPVDVAALQAKHLPQSVDIHDVVLAMKEVLQLGFFTLDSQRCLVGSLLITGSGGLILQLYQDKYIETIVRNGTVVTTSVSASAPTPSPIVATHRNGHAATVEAVLKSISASDSASVSTPTSETILSESVVKALTSPSRGGIAVQGNGHASTKEKVSTTGANPTVVSQSTVQTSVPTPATVTREDDRRAATVEAVLRSISESGSSSAPVRNPEAVLSESVIRTITSHPQASAVTVHNDSHASTVEAVLKSISESNSTNKVESGSEAVLSESIIRTITSRPSRDSSHASTVSAVLKSISESKSSAETGSSSTAILPESVFRTLTARPSTATEISHGNSSTIDAVLRSISESKPSSQTTSNTETVLSESVIRALTSRPQAQGSSQTNTSDASITTSAPSSTTVVSESTTTSPAVHGNGYASSIEAVLRSLPASESTISSSTAASQSATIYENGHAATIEAVLKSIPELRPTTERRSDSTVQVSVPDLAKAVHGNGHAATIEAVLKSISNMDPISVTSKPTQYEAVSPSGSVSSSETLYANGNETGSWHNVDSMKTPGLYFWQPAAATHRT